jgi:hypothetical protein
MSKQEGRKIGRSVGSDPLRPSDLPIFLFFLSSSSPSPSPSWRLLRKRVTLQSSVTLLDASERWDEWNEIASALANALRGRPLRVPAGTRGMAITVEVTSRAALPSGFGPGVDVSLLNIPLKKAPADQKRPRRVEILKIDPKVEVVPPDPSLSSPFKLPSVRIQLGTFFGLAFDPVDIGVPAQRVVHARVVKERTL